MLFLLPENFEFHSLFNKLFYILAARGVVGLLEVLAHFLSPTHCRRWAGGRVCVLLGGAQQCVPLITDSPGSRDLCGLSREKLSQGVPRGSPSLPPLHLGCEQ